MKKGQPVLQLRFIYKNFSMASRIQVLIVLLHLPFMRMIFCAEIFKLCPSEAECNDHEESVPVMDSAVEEAFQDLPTVNTKLSHLGINRLNDVCGLNEKELEELVDMLDLKGSMRLKFKSNTRMLCYAHNPIIPERLTMVTNQVYELEHLLERYLVQIDDHANVLKGVVDEQVTTIKDDLSRWEMDKYYQIDEWKKERRSAIKSELSTLQKSKKDIAATKKECERILYSDQEIEHRMRNVDAAITSLINEYAHFHDIARYIVENTKVASIEFDISTSIGQLILYGEFRDNVSNPIFDIPILTLNEAEIGVESVNEDGELDYVVVLKWRISCAMNGDGHYNQINAKIRSFTSTDKKEWESIRLQHIKYEEGTQFRQREYDGMYLAVPYSKYSATVHYDFAYDKMYEFQVNMRVDHPFSMIISSNVIKIEPLDDYW